MLPDVSTRATCSDLCDPHPISAEEPTHQGPVSQVQKVRVSRGLSLPFQPGDTQIRFQARDELRASFHAWVMPMPDKTLRCFISIDFEIDLLTGTAFTPTVMRVTNSPRFAESDPSSYFAFANPLQARSFQ